jgi:hypothetical protein
MDRHPNIELQIFRDDYKMELIRYYNNATVTQVLPI